ncbi:hypothetical protein CYLTODRAFT_403861 [Cylindrobasidium torrendii FP15055 ss-10]|uniref:Aminoglycoside phosphotransferase domain-containing protein n=1 Tax=Cylindrobasidium torrendii FP15055 ss-10 TaxID=1314674 RepID=A0A0D7AXP0_9AGAR|nr:hypothetical protein CYLTODRAFT_403861 [Cylindrobasidium torrendii FP15055 ss-10]
MSILVEDDFEPINSHSKPILPSDASIVEQCNLAYAASMRADRRVYFSGMAIVGDHQRFWVKFGGNIRLCEARTQHYVALRCVDADAPVRVPAVYRFLQYKSKGYIIMDFIDGRICTYKDAQAVGAAVSFLITIPAPVDQPGPGPIGGGTICHDFFVDRRSSFAYPTVKLLESHVNGILTHERRPQRVDLTPELEAYGLRLCLSDTNCGNFMVLNSDNQIGGNDDDKKIIVALDFDASCFLPISFFELAIHHPDPFTRSIKPFVVRPLSTQAQALDIASFSLVKYQTDKVGLPAELRKLIPAGSPWAPKN